MSRKHLFALLLALALPALSTLSACQSMLNRSIYEQRPHLDITVPADSNSMEITSYGVLVAVLRSWVRQGRTSGQMHFAGYDGDVKEDVTNACGEVMYNDAYGRYVEAYLSFVQFQDLTGAEVHISIKYMRDFPAAERRSLVSLSGVIGVQQMLKQTITTFSPYLAMDLPYWDATAQEVQAMAEDIYYANPLSSLGMPEISQQVYRSDKGMGCILELRFTYPSTSSILNNQLRLVTHRLDELMAPLDLSVAAPFRLLALHNQLTAQLRYDYETAAAEMAAEPVSHRPYTMAGALLDNLAVSEGYALAMQALCEKADIRSQIIRGTRGGLPHAWNLVYLNGFWYHVDAAGNDLAAEQPPPQAADPGDTSDEPSTPTGPQSLPFFLRDDTAMQEAEYRWQSDSKCEGGPLSYERLTEELRKMAPPQEPTLPANNSQPLDSEDAQAPPDDADLAETQSPPDADGVHSSQAADSAHDIQEAGEAQDVPE